MQADLTRITFDPDFDFTAVVQQQGRCEVEADWNEQARILTWGMRRLAEDLIGPHGGPAGRLLGFAIAAEPPPGAGSDDPDCEDGDFWIGKGVYYVHGIRVTNDAPVLFTRQPGRQPDLERCNTEHTYLVYLEVWERHVTTIEEPQIREVALLGPDTCTRLQLVWQVMVCEIHEPSAQAKKPAKKLPPAKVKEAPVEPLVWDKELELPENADDWQNAKRRAERDLRECTHREAPRLEARVKAGEVPDDPCVQAPSARYRGLENQLYRIEIHEAGDCPTFKWSRENGSVLFPILGWNALEPEQTVVDLDSLGRDERYGLVPNDIVEVVDDVVDLTHHANPLLTVVKVDASTRQVTLTGHLRTPFRRSKHPFLRRWDHRARDYRKLHHGAIRYQEDVWIDIEDGIQVRFEKRQAAPMTGDYWVIPARTVTGDIEWPPGRPQPTRYRLPRGIERSYAPLAYIKFGPNTTNIIDVRRRFDHLAR
jgi:hypothetical protein